MARPFSSIRKKQQIRLSASFAFSSPAHCLATFFGTGLLRPGPGTFGTAAGFITYLLLARFFSISFLVGLTVLLFFLGAFACEISGKDCGVHDHGSFVIDEVVGIWMVLLTLPGDFAWQFAGFCLFRFFDIVKLPPASLLDREVQNGCGVMLDDAAAALQALLLLQLMLLFF